MTTVRCQSPKCRIATNLVNLDICRACSLRDDPAEHSLLDPIEANAAGIYEPFCACGRRISQCDGSRRGCSHAPPKEPTP